MGDKINSRALSYKKNCKQKRPGEKQMDNLVIHEFSKTRSLRDVDRTLMVLFYLNKQYHREDVKEYLKSKINKTFCKSSVGRIYLVIEVIKKFELWEMLDQVLDKIKAFIKSSICSQSKKVEKIFKILKEANIDLKKILSEIEDDFKFCRHVTQAYRLAKIKF